jgi:hypothetical protein
MADTPTLTPPPDPVHHAAIETNIRLKSQELGMLGKLFGSRENAPINIAGALIVFGFLGCLGAPFLPSSPGFSLADMEKALSALIFAAFTFLGGYLGGAGTQK